ncbi:unnamed protein product, partial [Discosporangium mesarthrocarpum]
GQDGGNPGAAGGEWGDKEGKRGPAVPVHCLEELAQALGALNAMLVEGAGACSASGLQPGISPGDRRRLLEGFEALPATPAPTPAPAQMLEEVRGGGSNNGNALAGDGGEGTTPDVVDLILCLHRKRLSSLDVNHRLGLPPSLLRLFSEHRLPAALAAAAAAAAKAFESLPSASEVAGAGGSGGG